MAKDRQDRRKRTPFGVRKKSMNLDRDTEKRLEAEGLVPRWVNDDDNGERLRQAQEGDYDFIYAENVEVGDKKEKQEDRRKIRKLVGSNKDGSPKYAYLMAIRKEYYEEDQRAKEEINMKVDEAIRGGNPRGLEPLGVSPEKGRAFVKNIEYVP